MAEKTLTSKYTLNGNVATYTLTDVATKEDAVFTIDLGALISNPVEALKALANGVRIKMREATGGRTFDEAKALLSDMADALSGGTYPKRRESSETRTSPFIRALADVFCNGDTAQAQALFDEDVAEKARAAGIDLESDDDAAQVAAKKLRAKVRSDMAATKTVKAKLEAYKLEEMEAALVRARERAAAAAKAAE